MSQLLFVLLVVIVFAMSLTIVMLCIGLISNIIINRVKIEENKKNIIVEL
jgi:hypothetical protein